MAKGSIIIATFGAPKWHELALARAVPSAILQGPDYEVIQIHDNLAKSPSKPRNEGALKASSEWICFLDADDELERGYMDAMLEVPGDIRYPLVRRIPENFLPGSPLPAPQILPRKCLILGNYIVVGALQRRDLFLAVGGFDEHETYEDWALYLKLTYCGAQPFLCPKAVYRNYRRSGSRVMQTKNAQQTVRDILNHFRQWAFRWDGGMTEDPQYRAWLARDPAYPINAAKVSDRKV